MTFLVAFALAGLPVSATEPPDDTVIQMDGTVLHGRVLSCGDAVRFVPVGSAEILLEAKAVREVRLASGEPCPLVRRSSNLAGGIAAMFVFPVVGFFLGGIVGQETCQAGDRTPCAYGGALVGTAAGLLLGGTFLVAAIAKSNDPVPATAREKRSVGLSLVIRF